MVRGRRHRKPQLVIHLNLHWAFGAAVVVAIALSIKLLA
jgi:hypothetical protein